MSPRFLGGVAVDALEGPDFRTVMLRVVRHTPNDVGHFAAVRATDWFNKLSWRDLWVGHETHSPLPYKAGAQLSLGHRRLGAEPRPVMERPCAFQTRKANHLHKWATRPGTGREPDRTILAKRMRCLPASRGASGVQLRAFPRLRPCHEAASCVPGLSWMPPYGGILGRAARTRKLFA